MNKAEVEKYRQAFNESLKDKTFSISAPKNTGLTINKNADSLDSGVIAALNTASKLLGVSTTIVDSVDNGIANASYGDGQVKIEKGNENPVGFLFGHEIFHHLTALLGDEVTAYSNAVANTMPDELASEIRRNRDAYAKNGITMSEADIYEEALGNVTGVMFSDTDSLQNFIENNRGDRNLLQKVLDAVKEVIAKVTGKMTGKEAEHLNDVQYQLEKALEKASKASEKTATGQKNNTVNGVKYSLVGINEHGVEVYETNYDIKNLSVSERIQKFKEDFKKQFVGRRAKFIRNGHIQYAKFDLHGLGKFVYNDAESDKQEYKAKIRLLANGDIFELVENSQHLYSLPEKGKTSAAHRNVTNWDYYWKSIIVDNIGYDVLINVKNKIASTDSAQKEQYTYSIDFIKNNKATPSAASNAKKQTGLNLESIASNNSKVPQSDTERQDYSMQNSEKNSQGTEKTSLKGSEPVSAELRRAQEKAEYFKSQLRKTKIPTPDAKSIKNLAKEYLADYGGTTTVDELGTELTATLIQTLYTRRRKKKDCRSVYRRAVFFFLCFAFPQKQYPTGVNTIR